MSKLSRHSSRNVPLAKPRACAKCGSPFHSLCPRDRTPIERTTRVNPRREEPRRSEREHNANYLAWVHTQPCCAVGLPGHVCGGRIEADHAGERPLGRKADDDTCIAICSQGHRERTDFSGPFKTWSRDEMRA